METRKLSLRDGMFESSLLEGGSGQPLFYLHGTWAAEWGPFLDALAAERRVVAPIQPGFGDSSGDEHLLDLHDLIYYHLDLLDALDLHGLPLIGHSLGGMIAAELAAVQPRRFTKLVLIAPLGLWNEAYPVPDFFTYGPDELAPALFHDPDSPRLRATLQAPAETEAGIAFRLERAKALATSAKYLWPLPNRGLSKRLHRVTMPTLLVWGERDGICPPEYAADFQSRLPRAQLCLIPDAAHLPHVEHPDTLADLVRGFLS
jgi:pimeloyl-ACP methyl ester carboxylesterase